MAQYRMHTVTPGDTIQYLGDLYSVDWREIVTINGLKYPYIDTDIVDNEFAFVDTVAKIGNKLLIPNTSAVLPLKSNNTAGEVEKYAFGCDLDLYEEKISSHGVLNLETEGNLSDAENGDVLTVEGIENLRQQISTRLGTPKGTLLLHPEWGSNLLSYIGRRMTPELLTEVSLEIQECVLSDFRVQQVSDITVQFADRRVLVECIIYPIEPYSSMPFQFSHQFKAE